MRKKIKCCDEYCIGCFHHAENLNVCLYILDTTKRRPCPAGKGCEFKFEGIRKARPDEMEQPGTEPAPILPFNYWKEHGTEY